MIQLEEVKSVTILEKLNRLSELENDLIATLDMICFYVSNFQTKTLKKVNDEENDESKKYEMNQIVYNNLKTIMDCVSNLEFAIDGYQTTESRKLYDYILSNKINLIREKEDIEHDLMLARKQDDSSDNPRKTSLTLEPKDNGKD